MEKILFRDRDKLSCEPLTGMKQVKIAFDEALYSRIKAAAEEYHTSIAEIARVAIDRLLTTLEDDCR